MTKTKLQPLSRAARRRVRPDRRSRRAWHVVISALALCGSAALATPLANVAVGATTVPTPWIPCTNATLGSGTCVPGYGSAVYNGKDGYFGVPAILNGPAQLYLSPVFCPAGSPAAKSGEACSAPFQLALSKITLTPAIGVIRVENFGYESSAGTNADGAVAVLDNPLALPGSDQAAHWCVTVPTSANPQGESCIAESNTSLPVYLAATSPPVLGTVLMCVGGQLAASQNAFEACMQSSVGTKPFASTRARNSTLRKTAVKKQTSPVAVTLSAPAISSHVLAVGTSGNIKVTVTATSGSLTQVTVRAGVTPTSSSVVGTTKPQFAGASVLSSGVTRAFTFTFSAKALKAGKVTIDVTALAQLASGAAATGSAQLVASVG